MSQLELQLTEELFDVRARERVYTLRVANRQAEQATVYALTPRVPDGVVLVEVRNSAVVAAKRRQEQLTEELTSLLNQHVLASSVETRERVSAALREVVKQAIQIGGIMQMILSASSALAERDADQGLNGVRSLRIKIETASEAQEAYERFLKDDKAVGPMGTVYLYKLGQLRSLEELHGEKAQKPLAIIEPKSDFDVSYTLRFPRHLTDARKYSFAIDVAYGFGETRSFGGASSVLEVGASPVALSLVAMLGGVLGTVIRVGLVKSTGAATGGELSGVGDLQAGIWGSTWDQIARPETLAAIILALVVFNIYEHTSLSSKIRIGLGWRAALLVGTLAGLFADRFVAALNAFVQ